MATIEGFEAQLRPFKLALLEAFGLDPGKTSSNVSVDSESASFKVIGAGYGDFQNAIVRHDGLTESVPTVIFEAQFWTEAQRQAVEAYRGQFPSFEDLPREFRASLRDQHEHMLSESISDAS